MLAWTARALEVSQVIVRCSPVENLPPQANPTHLNFSPSMLSKKLGWKDAEGDQGLSMFPAKVGSLSLRCHTYWPCGCLGKPFLCIPGGAQPHSLCGTLGGDTKM